MNYNVDSQLYFDSMYITAAELAKKIGYSRSGLWHLIDSGVLPKPITAGKAFQLWERSEIEPFLSAFGD